jgi:UDP-MurNAc hydroxylase
MKFINLGGATGIIEHRGKRMLFDPWADDGIFHGAWYHWPKMKWGPTELGRFDYVYISHIHEDHCSAGTMKHLNRDAEIILMDSKPNFVVPFLQRHGFDFEKIHLVRPRTPTELEPGLAVDMVEADPANELSYVIDSALMLRWGDYIVYNANDCQPYPGGLDYILSAYPRIDLALLPYASSSAYPACYVNLTEEERQSERMRVMNGRLAAFVKTVQRLIPRRVMPFADQYVVAGSRSYLNKWIAHPSGPGVVKAELERVGLLDRLVLLNSGQAYDLDKGSKSPDEPYVDVSDEDRERYIASSLKGKLYDHERVTFLPSVPVERLVGYACKRLWEIQERRKSYSETALYLDFPSLRRRFHVPLNVAEMHEVNWDAPLVKPYLRISAPDTLMSMILIGHVSWNIADAALFLDFDRQPNVYDPSVYVLLNYLRV